MLMGTQWGQNWEQQKPNIHALHQKKMHLGPLGWMLPHLIGCKIFLGLLVFFAILALGLMVGA
jgi:hypothetical protein